MKRTFCLTPLPPSVDSECKLVYCSVLRRVYIYIWRIYSSVTKGLKFDWSIQLT